MVRIDHSRSTIVAVRDTTIGIDWQFTHASLHSLADQLNEQSLLTLYTVHGLVLLTFIPNYLIFPFMFRFPSLTMRRLLLFLVFAAIGAPNPVEDFDEWDFQRRQDTLGIVNGSHSISGAAFTPEPPVVLVKALKTLWTYIPFPEIPQLDPKPLNQILDQALFELNDLGCSNTNAPTRTCSRIGSNCYVII